MDFIWVCLDVVADRADLPIVPTAPSTESQMDPEAHARGAAEVSVEVLRLRLSGLMTTRRNLCKPLPPFSPQVHVNRS